MNEPTEERQALWKEFLKRWPLGSLADMTLEQYSSAGKPDCFVYWLEILTEALGSIWEDLRSSLASIRVAIRVQK